MRNTYLSHTCHLSLCTNLYAHNTVHIFTGLVCIRYLANPVETVIYSANSSTTCTTPTTVSNVPARLTTTATTNNQALLEIPISPKNIGLTPVSPSSPLDHLKAYNNIPSRGFGMKMENTAVVDVK